MRTILISSGALAAFLLTITAASAQTAPKTIYCLVQGGDARSYNCSYATVEACNQERMGAGGTCVAYRPNQTRQRAH